jgi:methylase of polypeptide subunit release factors
MQEELTTGRLLAEGIRVLSGCVETPQLDAELLLSHALRVGRARLKSHPEEARTSADVEHFRALLTRRAKGEPLAYIVGRKGFWTLTLTVSPAVLVPRPETELIVERALELLPAGEPERQSHDTEIARGPATRTRAAFSDASTDAEHAGAANMRAPAAFAEVTAADTRAPAAFAEVTAANIRAPAASAGAGASPSASAIRVADLGTGSGAIALALASERPGWLLTATDVSPEALAVAQANASSLALNNVRFVQGRWLEPLAGERFHLIASNPPYVAQDDAALDSPALRHEPQIALTPGPDAMADLKRIITDAPEHLERGGWLLLEHGLDQAPEVARELVARGFRHVRSHRDLAGLDRMTEGQWPA